ncbi:hypothetical protein [Streptomyces sp. NPDC018833]|uniref:hypothetical protein n=1 Tax=Streptomyces sp. NPDC018833 TaxID=3365053 RepID=UPI0037A95855
MDGERPVAERVGYLVGPAPLRGSVAGRQLNAGTAVEVCANLVVLHLTPLSGKIISLMGCRILRSSHTHLTTHWSRRWTPVTAISHAAHAHTV